jgi:hypothetical protein
MKQRDAVGDLADGRDRGKLWRGSRIEGNKNSEETREPKTLP